MSCPHAGQNFGFAWLAKKLKSQLRQWYECIAAASGAAVTASDEGAAASVIS